MTKTLADFYFPKPPEDNKRGLHWSGSQYFWGQDRWDYWRKELIDMKIKWVKLLDDGSGSAFGLCQRLVDIGIMPVVRIFRQEPNPGTIHSREIDHISKLVKLGVYYFETNNEPDLPLEWEDGKRPENWLDIVVDNFIMEADMVHDVGGYLLFPAFGPGGRGNPFQMIVDRGRADLFDGKICLAIHNYCLGRPLDYPNDDVTLNGTPITEQEWWDYGGKYSWEMGYDEVNRHRKEMANPNANIMEDSTCFRAFEYFDTLINQACGHSIPIMTTEGGYNVRQRAGTTFGDDPRYPKLGELRTSQAMDEMYEYMEKDAPYYYFACMSWLAAVSEFGYGAQNFEIHSWYSSLWQHLDGKLPLVDILKSREPLRVQKTVEPIAWQWRHMYEGRDVDYRLKFLVPHVVLKGYDGDADEYWRCNFIHWQDEREGASGNIFVRMLDRDGKILEGKPFDIETMDGQHTYVQMTKGQIDNGYGDMPMYQPLGSYRLSIGDNCDVIENLGMGGEGGSFRTSFFIEYQLVDKGYIMLDEQKYIDEFLASDTPVNDAIEFGVEIKDVPEATLKIRGVHLLEPDENEGKHHMFFRKLDRDGNPVAGVLNWTWLGRGPDEAAPPIVFDGDNLPDLAIWRNQIIDAWLGNIGESDVVTGLTTGFAGPGGGSDLYHQSYYVVWQETGNTEPEEPEQPEPEEPEPEQPSDDEWEQLYNAKVAEFNVLKQRFEALLAEHEWMVAELQRILASAEDDDV